MPVFWLVNHSSSKLMGLITKNTLSPEDPATISSAEVQMFHLKFAEDLSVAIKSDAFVPASRVNTYPTKGIVPIIGANIAPSLKPVISVLSRPVRYPGSTAIAPPAKAITGFATSFSAIERALPEEAIELN